MNMKSKSRETVYSMAEAKSHPPSLNMVLPVELHFFEICWIRLPLPRSVFGQTPANVFVSF